MNKKELSTHKFYLKIAELFSTRSKDPRLKVGCIIVSRSGLIFPGYNGDEKGGSNKPDSLEPGKSGFVHAEQNALVRFDPSIHKDSIAYLTDSPCIVCARLIVNCQAISKVFYTKQYRDTTGIKILIKRNIICQQIKI